MNTGLDREQVRIAAATSSFTAVASALRFVVELKISHIVRSPTTLYRVSTVDAARAAPPHVAASTFSSVTDTARETSQRSSCFSRQSRLSGRKRISTGAAIAPSHRFVHGPPVCSPYGDVGGKKASAWTEVRRGVEIGPGAGLCVHVSQVVTQVAR